MAGEFSFPGIGSSIDGLALAKATFDQLTLVNVIHRKNVSNLKSENSSLEKLRTFLLDISSSLDSSRSANGGVSGAKKAVSADPKIATAISDTSAAEGSFTVTVNSLAASATGSFNRSYSAKNDFVISDPSQAGDLQFSVGTGDSATSFSVSVDESTTVDSLVSEFNSKAGGKASASVVNVGTEASPSYRIAFSSREAGTEKGSIAITPTNAALLDPTALGGTTLNQATNAVIQISGISGTIERASNTVSDIISGVTIQLTGTGTTSIAVQNDAEASVGKLESFVSAFNKLAAFLNTEDKVTSSKEEGEQVNIYGALAKTGVDDQALSSLRSAISQSRSKGGELSLAAIGVSTQRNGTLAIDQKKFEEAFQANPNAVNEVISSLADKVSGVEGVVHQFAGFGLQIDQQIKGNESHVAKLEEKISNVERNARTREEGVRRQFTSLDRLFAKLQAASSYLSSILKVE